MVARVRRAGAELTAVTAVAELFETTVSGVVVEAVAVLVMVAPGWVPALTRTTRVKLTLAPGARSAAAVQLIAPVPPTAGTVPQVQPAGGVMDWKVVPVGTLSARAGFAAGLGPLFVMPIVYVRSAPAWTGSGVSVLVTARSARGFTVVWAVAVLFAVVTSVSLEVTEAVFVMVPVAFGVTTTVTVALCPLASTPIEQVRVGLANEHVPWVVKAETKVRVPGRVSVTLTLLAVRRLFVATIV